MNQSTIDKVFLTRIVLSTIIFALLSFPIVLLGAKPICMNLLQSRIVDGKLMNAATR
ncbi:hypothetical protein BJP36_39140 [Moorena producens JHB]|uniref:Uncharacterized protein n=1 Tax=Moorena producens (strain JHB) TaxID=1454205 RepID=A0A9Q9SUX5_MOOP1|nr:hypothetical protein [Moorena producens]WAN70080.1 hypothetical protein BJP36_39140 [Moorena producens JHB]